MWPDSMQGILAPRTDEVQRRDLALKVQGAGNAKKQKTPIKNNVKEAVQALVQ
jgi:hypothetical protein